MGRRVGGLGNRSVENVPDIHNSSIDHPLLVIVRPLQNRPAPLAHQALRHTLDLGLRALRLGVEKHDLADAARQQRLLLDRHARQRREDLSLDVVCRQAAVGHHGFEEELDSLQEVGLRVKHSVLDILAVEECHYLREQLHFLDGGLANCGSIIVGLACSFHSEFDIGDELVEFLFKILAGNVSI